MDRRALVLGGLGCTALAAGRWRPARADEPAAPFALTGQLTQGGWARGLVPPGTAHLALDGKPVRIAADGRFLIAFDRDAGPVARLLAETADGMVDDYAVPIARRAWQIEHIPIGPRPGAPPSEEFARRRAGELEQINAARAIERAAEGWRQTMIWPVSGRLSGRFGAQRIYNGTPGSYHSGTDIATGASGTPFVAPADGVVMLAAENPFTLEGRLLMIDHGMGLNSAFLHCSDHAVALGDRVNQGQVIGRIGATGRATGPHLHWSLKWREARLDAELFVPPMRGDTNR
ncbi:MAG: M23 family metallopeptidase [Novosphingobium sp.]